MLEMCLIVAMVLQEFDLELLPDQAIRPLPKITLRPNGPVRMALRLVDRRPTIQKPNERMQLTGPAFRTSTPS
jgi:hypothetical protein